MNAWNHLAAGGEAPVNSARRVERLNWEEVVSELAQIDLAEMAGALRMGDLLLQVERQFGSEHLKDAVQQAGLVWSTAHQRLWVSKKIPPGSPVRRNRSLNYSMLRILAGTADPEQWADQVEEQGWTAAELLEAVQSAGDQEVQQSGGRCRHCEGPLPEVEGLVSLSIGKERRVRLCGRSCAREYLAEEHGPDGEEHGPDGAVEAPCDPWA